MAIRIAVFGSGAVGGYFGARLAAAGHDVAFIARGEHLSALQRRGLAIESPKGNLHIAPIRATDDPATIGAVDVVFFTVKMYDGGPAAAAARPLLVPGTAVVTFQNGVESVEILSRALWRA